MFGFVAPLAGSADGQGEDAHDESASDEITIKLPKAQKTVVYGIAIASGLGAYLLLGQLVGGGMGMPRFEAAVVGNLELAWLIPLSLVGTVCGWLYFVSEHASEALAHAMGERPIAKAMLAGLVLAACGTALPFTMFAGETQADVLMETYLTIPAGVLIATGLVKAMLTPAPHQYGLARRPFLPRHLLGRKPWAMALLSSPAQIRSFASPSARPRRWAPLCVSPSWSWACCLCASRSRALSA